MSSSPSSSSSSPMHPSVQSSRLLAHHGPTHVGSFTSVSAYLVAPSSLCVRLSCSLVSSPTHPFSASCNGSLTHLLADFASPRTCLGIADLMLTSCQASATTHSFTHSRTDCDIGSYTSSFIHSFLDCLTARFT